MHIPAGERTRDCRHELGFTPLKQRGGPVKDEREFVADAVGDGDVGEIFNDLDSSSVHEVECTLVVGFREAMAGGESVTGGC